LGGEAGPSDALSTPSESTHRPGPAVEPDSVHVGRESWGPVNNGTVTSVLHVLENVSTTTRGADLTQFSTQWSANTSWKRKAAVESACSSAVLRAVR
jgi:hypothetical protein